MKKNVTFEDELVAMTFWIL